MPDFCSSVKNHFLFLETEYGCKLESSRNETWGGEVIYRNQTTGVKLVYEFSGAFIYVFIYKLINGKLIDNPRTFALDTEITCFDFNDALPDSEKMKPAYEYGSKSHYYDEQNGLSYYVHEFALRLKKYGGAVLSGDFSILPEMGKVIKERAGAR